MSRDTNCHNREVNASSGENLVDTVDVLTKVDDQADITCLSRRVSFFGPSPSAKAGLKGEENSAITFV